MKYSVKLFLKNLFYFLIRSLYVVHKQKTILGTKKDRGQDKRYINSERQNTYQDKVGSAEDNRQINKRQIIQRTKYRSKHVRGQKVDQYKSDNAKDKDRSRQAKKCRGQKVDQYKSDKSQDKLQIKTRQVVQRKKRKFKRTNSSRDKRKVKRKQESSQDKSQIQETTVHMQFMGQKTDQETAYI